MSPAVAELTNAQNRGVGFGIICSSGIAIGILGGAVGGRLPGWMARLAPGTSVVAQYRAALWIGCAIVLLGLVSSFEASIAHPAFASARKPATPPPAAGGHLFPCRCRRLESRHRCFQPVLQCLFRTLAHAGGADRLGVLVVATRTGSCDPGRPAGVSRHGIDPGNFEDATAVSGRARLPGRVWRPRNGGASLWRLHGGSEHERARHVQLPDGLGARDANAAAYQPSTFWWPQARRRLRQVYLDCCCGASVIRRYCY